MPRRGQQNAFIRVTLPDKSRTVLPITPETAVTDLLLALERKRGLPYALHEVQYIYQEGSARWRAAEVDALVEPLIQMAEVRVIEKEAAQKAKVSSESVGQDSSGPVSAATTQNNSVHTSWHAIHAVHSAGHLPSAPASKAAPAALNLSGGLASRPEKGSTSSILNPLTSFFHSAHSFSQSHLGKKGADKAEGKREEETAPDMDRSTARSKKRRSSVALRAPQTGNAQVRPTEFPETSDLATLMQQRGDRSLSPIRQYGKLTLKGLFRKVAPSSNASSPSLSPTLPNISQPLSAAANRLSTFDEAPIIEEEDVKDMPPEFTQSRRSSIGGNEGAAYSVRSSRRSSFVGADVNCMTRSSSRTLSREPSTETLDVELAWRKRNLGSMAQLAQVAGSASPSAIPHSISDELDDDVASLTTMDSSTHRGQTAQFRRRAGTSNSSTSSIGNSATLKRTRVRRESLGELFTQDDQSEDAIALTFVDEMQHTTTLNASPTTKLDTILKHLCLVKKLRREDYTFYSPQVKEAIVLDRTVGYYRDLCDVKVYMLKPGNKSYSTMSVTEDGHDVMIYQMTEGKLFIMAGTIEKLIGKATDVDPDQQADEKYLDTLLLTFRSFVRPADFFEYLMSMFNAELPADPSPADLQYFDMVKEPTQQRVTEVIERWVSNFWHDFDQSASLMEDLNSFMEQLEQAGAGYAEASRFIANEVERQTRIYEDMLTLRKAVERKSKTMDSIFDSLHPEQIAQQLCLCDFKCFKNIHPIEFLYNIWGKKNVEDAATPNLDFFSARFELECYWLASEICHTTQLKARVKKMASFIQIAKVIYKFPHCKELNNFFSMFALVAGLNLTPVNRLTKTWAGLSKQSKQDWAELERACDPTRNMKAYRDMFAKATKPGANRQVAIYLKDLIFMNDGNPSKIKDLINFDKLRMMGGHVLELTQLAEVEYPYTIDPVITNYLHKPHLDMSFDALRDLSRALEPNV